MKPEIIIPQVYRDNRGYFMETFRHNTALFHPVQENESQSAYGTIRGLHYQEGKHAQAKLVRVTYGAIHDVIVNLKTGEVLEFRLNSSNHKQLFIPRGWAHGFSVLSDVAVVIYKASTYYNKESERGFNPLSLGIDWRIEEENMIISDKDLKWPKFHVKQ